tara:strand:- start:107 stop:373 length:267 start_codon:yes stop_codon:yes gene_type:complete
MITSNLKISQKYPTIFLTKNLKHQKAKILLIQIAREFKATKIKMAKSTIIKKTIVFTTLLGLKRTTKVRTLLMKDLLRRSSNLISLTF